MGVFRVLYIKSINLGYFSLINVNLRVSAPKNSQDILLSISNH